jgi:hypothetical protein
MFFCRDQVSVGSDVGAAAGWAVVAFAVVFVDIVGTALGDDVGCIVVALAVTLLTGVGVVAFAVALRGAAVGPTVGAIVG